MLSCACASGLNIKSVPTSSKRSCGISAYVETFFKATEITCCPQVADNFVVNLSFNCPKENHPAISLKRVWGQREATEGCRREGGVRAILLYWIQKPTVVTIGLCCFFRVWRRGRGQGSYPFELFRRSDNGWMLRTYVERPPWLMEEELHAGPAVWENTRPLLSLLTSQLMNAWMAECRYRPFRGQSPQELTLAQMHQAMAIHLLNKLKEKRMVNGRVRPYVCVCVRVIEKVREFMGGRIARREEKGDNSISPLPQ